MNVRFGQSHSHSTGLYTIYHTWDATEAITGVNLFAYRPVLIPPCSHRYTAHFVLMTACMCCMLSHAHRLFLEKNPAVSSLLSGPKSRGSFQLDMVIYYQCLSILGIPGFYVV